VRRGHAYVAADDAQRAEIAYRHAIDLTPDLADAHLALARLYHTHGREDAADWHAQRFVELAPPSVDGPALLAAMRQSASSEGRGGTATPRSLPRDARVARGGEIQTTDEHR
jgi:tetratricopeptide (TPR) repeat protein